VCECLGGDHGGYTAQKLSCLQTAVASKCIRTLLSRHLLSPDDLGFPATVTFAELWFNP